MRHSLQWLGRQTWQRAARTLISGWGLGDTHGGVSNFRYGLDNWIWAMQGYNNSKPEFDGQQSQSFRQGFWRFKLSKTDPPKVTDLEFIRSSDNNTWGLGISEDGLIFGSTANHNPSMFVPIPNRYYERVRGWARQTLHSIADTYKFNPITDKVRQVDQFGGYTAGAGHALYTARAFPKQWWNKTAFVCGPTGHLVGTFVLRRDGANYTSTSPVNLLASDDEWSAPIMAEVGPDGAVWVMDWYNYIVQHNPTPHGFKTGKGAAYESDLRDKKHGRIFRVVATDGESDVLHSFQSLQDATNAQLVATLKHPSFRWRLHAQRLLIERGADDVLEPLTQLLADETKDDAGLNVGAIHAIHTLAGLGYVQLDPRFKASGIVGRSLATALKHPSAAVRRNAVAALPHDQHGLKLLLDAEDLFRDDDHQVKLQAILTLSDMPVASQTGHLVAQLARNEADPVLIDALTSAAATHSISFLQQVASTPDQPSPATLKITQQITQHVARSKPDANSLQQIVAGLADASPALSVALVDGLTQGLPSGYEVKSTPSLDAAFVKSFKSGNNVLKGKLLGLASRSGVKSLDSFAEEITDAMVSAMEDEDATAAQRGAAARDLVGLRPGDADVVETVAELLRAAS